jgi:S-adenosylhomocysteine hydrolase
MNFPTTRILPLLLMEREAFHDVDLGNTSVVCVQHLCSTTYALFEALFSLGLKKENLWVLGKCYSSNPLIYYQLLKDGVNVSPASLDFDSHISYDEYFDSSVDLLLHEFLTNKNLKDFDRIIVLDDGGHLLERARNLFPPDLKIIGIEQTSSGYNRLKNLSFNFPIINTARSWLKLEYESPIIIDLVQRMLFQALATYSSTWQKILIIGYGSLGKFTHEILKNQFQVSFFDIQSEKTNIPACDFKKRLKEFDIIIGSTGNTSLTKQDFKYLKKNVLLASISSSDREFDAIYLRKKYENYRDCHKNIYVDGIRLLNSGFPITFSNDFDSIDTDDFQLTRAILFSSICQSVKFDTKATGFIDFMDKIQMRIFNNLCKITYENKQKSSSYYRRFARTGGVPPI